MTNMGNFMSATELDKTDLSEKMSLGCLKEQPNVIDNKTHYPSHGKLEEYKAGSHSSAFCFTADCGNGCSTRDI